jgi:hypothetical protein
VVLPHDPVDLLRQISRMQHPEAPAGFFRASENNINAHYMLRTMRKTTLM